MKTLLLAGIMTAAFGTACYAGQFWVVGNRGTGKCDIVTSNPVVYSLPGYAGSGSEYNVWLPTAPTGQSTMRSSRAPRTKCVRRSRLRPTTGNKAANKAYLAALASNAVLDCRAGPRPATPPHRVVPVPPPAAR